MVLLSQKQLSVRQNRGVPLANWLIRPACSDKRAPRQCPITSHEANSWFFNMRLYLPFFYLVCLICWLVKPIWVACLEYHPHLLCPLLHYPRRPVREKESKRGTPKTLHKNKSTMVPRSSLKPVQQESKDLYSKREKNKRLRSVHGSPVGKS